jgi:alpha-glucosidase
MGSPQQLSADEYAELEKAGELAEIKPPKIRTTDGDLAVTVVLPRQAVSLLTFEPAATDPTDAERTSSGNETSKVEPVPDAIRAKFKLAPFYQKHIDAGGLPILSSAKVSDAALHEAAYLINQMLAYRSDVRDELIERGVRFVVMAPDEMTTDVPEQAHMDSEYWDRRARGLGGRICSCGEENLLKLPDDRYGDENILIHEFSHTIHNYGLRRLDDDFNDRLKSLYESAMQKGLWKGTYAAANPEEYWAEGVQSYFDCNARPRRGVHNDVDTRDELREYDPELFQLVDASFGRPSWRYERYEKRFAAAGK